MFLPNVEMNLYMYPYFIIGFYYAKYMNANIMKRLNKLKYSSFLLFPIMVVFYKKTDYIYVSGFYGDTGLLEHMPTNLYRWVLV